jgi:tape measure domain-containing protein
MTSEQIRLEIQLEVKRALADLGTMSEELKRLAAEARKFIPPANDMKAIMGRLGQDLKTSAKAASLFGDELGGLRQQQASLKTAMVQLLEQGLEPQSDEIRKLKAQYDQLGEESKSLAGQSSLASGSIGDLTAALGQVAAVKVLADVAGKIIAIGDASLETAKQWEKQEANFGVLLGSAEAGRAVFRELQDFNVWTPFDLDNITNTAQVLMGANVEVGDLTDKMTMFGDLSLGNAEKFSSFANEFAKVAVKGKVDMGNLNIYLERGIPILSTLADQFGVTGDKVQDMVSKGQVSAQDFERALVKLTSQGGLYYQGMVTGSQSLEAIQIGLKEAQDALGAAFMSGLIPALKMGTRFFTDITNAINDSPLLKGLLAGAVVMATGYLAAMAIKTAALTIKTWLQYAAQMGLNASLAVTNPLLIAGIIAVGVATAAAVIYASRQAKAAEETDRQALASVAAARSMSTAAKAAKEYAAAIDSMSDAELRSARAAILASMQRSSGMDALTVAAAKIKELDKELDSRPAAAPATSIADAEKKAAAFKASWADFMAKTAADSSLDPFAGIDYERAKKLAEAAANGIGVKNKAVIDEINAYYDARRREVADTLAADEAARMVKLSATRVDDLESEKAAALSSLAQLEAKRLATASTTEEARAEIADRYAAMRASVQAGYDKQIAATSIAEARAAAEAVWNETNAAAVAAAKLTATRADDLALERDQALTLFEGTEQQKLTLAQDYARQIADASIAEDKRAFEESLRLAAENKDYGAYAGLAADKAASGTEVGQTLGFGGAAAVDPMMMLIQSLVEFAMSIENVQKVLNPFSTILEGARALLEPLTNDALQPLVDILMDIGGVLAQTLAPFITLIAINLRVLSAVIQIAMIPIRLLGNAFAWFNNKVIVPIGNAIINMINGVIKALNKIPFVNIKLLETLKTTDQIIEAEKQIASKTQAVSDEMDRVRQVFADRRKDIEDAYRKNVASLQKLLELGAMSESEYDQRIVAANVAKDVSLAMLQSAEERQIDALDAILDQLKQGLNVSVQVLRDAGVPGFASGAVTIPADTRATVHKGEMIVPAPFAQGVRSGEITIGAGAASGSVEIYNIALTVNGSVLTKDDLVNGILDSIQTKRKRGTFPAGVVA